MLSGVESRYKPMGVTEGIEKFWQKIAVPAGHGVSHGLSRAAGESMKFVGEKTWGAYSGSARWVYEVGRFTHQHTSHSPVYYEDNLEGKVAGIKNTLISRPGNPAETVVSLPFRMGDENIRAVKTSKVLDLWDQDYPMMLLAFLDPNPKIIGDEVLQLEARGAAKDILRNSAGRNPKWRLWMPGSYEIAVESTRGQKEVVHKDQASLHAGDVIQMFIDSIEQSTQGQIILSEVDLHKALSMITIRSESLQKRWELLDERLKLERHLTSKPDVLASFMWPIMDFAPQQFQDFNRRLLNGEIKTVGQWNQAFAAMPDLMVEPTSAILPRVIFNSLNMVPGKVDQSKLVQIPAMLFMSVAGISYLNAVLDGYEEHVMPQIKRQGEQTALLMKESTAAIADLKAAEVEAWKAARLEIEAKKPELIAALKDQARELISDSADAAKGALTGTQAVTKVK